MERSRTRIRRGGLAASLLVVAATAATAQVVVPPGALELEDAEIFKPTTDVGDFITVYDSDAVPPGRFTLGLWGDYAQDPLEIQFEDSEDRFSKLVETVGTAQFTGAVGVADRFALGLRVPLYITDLTEVRESGNGSTGDGTQFNIGDVAVNAQYTLLKRRESGVGLAIIPEVIAPSGSEKDFAGTGEFGYGGVVALDFAPSERFRLGFNGGGVSRGSPFNDQIKLGGAASLDLSESMTAIVESYSLTSTKSPFSKEKKTPVDVIGALQLHLGQVNVTVGGGAGMTRGQGSPEFRVFMGLTPPKPKEDEVLVAGDLSQSRKVSALRDMDRDGRTSPGDILEYTITMVNSGNAEITNVRVVDPIPPSTKYLAGTITVNGRPVSDAVEDDAGELSGPPDTVVARIERLEAAAAPEEGGTAPGSEATVTFQVEIDRELTAVTTVTNMASAAADGVPEFPLPPNETTVFPAIRESERVIVTPDRIELTEEIHFEFDKAVIRRESFDILKELAGVLQQYPTLRIRIEGNTDSVGTDDYNQRLSERRALAVRDFLVGVGIDQSRMEWIGRGESAPIATNDTPTGRAKNRRTEFIVLNPEALGGKTVEKRAVEHDLAPESEPAWLKRGERPPE